MAKNNVVKENTKDKPEKLYTLELSYTDRMYLPNLFTEKGNIATQILEQDIWEKLKLTQDDMSFIQLAENEERGITKWDKDLAQIKRTFTMTQAEMSHLKGLVEKADAANKITKLTLGAAINIRDAQEQGND